ncbi:MAG: hypothetical protein ABGW82_14075 [Paracoccus sp. (in: a-proteobacteria)]
MRIGSAIAAFVMLVGTGHMASAATVIKQPSTITLVRHEYDCNYCQPGQVKPVAGILNGLSTGNPVTGIVTFTFDDDSMAIDMQYGSGQEISSPGRLAKWEEGVDWTVGAAPAWRIDIDWDTMSGLFSYEGDETPYLSAWAVSFSPSPVPVPGEAGLGRVGIGEVAWLRLGEGGRRRGLQRDG